MVLKQDWDAHRKRQCVEDLFLSISRQLYTELQNLDFQEAYLHLQLNRPKKKLNV